MRTLVTGGAGFIGSHLVDALRARASGEVTVLDDFSTGARANLPCAVDVVEGSVGDAALVRELVGSHDLVFHLAAAVGVDYLRTRPVQAMATNVRGAMNVVEAAAAARRALVLASSSEVYGSGPPPLRESAPLRLGASTCARTAYAGAKLLAECAAFAHGVDVLVVRIFNTVGPRQRARHGMVLPRLVGQALAGEPLTVYGDGSQTRCFAHVDDVVASILGLVDAGRFGEVFNVGSSRETTIAELAACVLRETGAASGVRRVPFEAAHPGCAPGPRRRVPCLDRLRGVLGVVPERAVEAIVGDVVAARLAALRG